MNVVLFGATGYLGSHVAEQLTLAGIDSLCLVRPQSNITFLDSIGIAHKSIDFDSLEGCQEYIGPRTVVINCIADTRIHASYEQREAVEIHLTQSLFAIAQRQQAARFIQLSTVMVYGFQRPETAINEDFPLSPTYLYNRVAADRESSLTAMHKPGSTELVIIRPSNAFGERDPSLLPSFLRSHRKGVFPVVDGGQWRFSLIDARDVGRAFVHMIAAPVDTPETFLVKGFDTDWLEFKHALDNVLDSASTVYNIPKRATAWIARCLECLYPYGKQPPITRFDLDVLSTHTLFDDSKIRQLGFTPVHSLTQGLTSVLKP